MSDSQADKGDEDGFRVVDRRRFEQDGSERADERGAAPGPTETASTDPAEGSPSQTSSDRPPSPADFPPRAEDPGPAGFSSLVLSLSTQALLCLGEITETADAEPRVDLVAGRQLIDLLAVLQEKTQGNLDAGEAELLERVLYDLRIRFVEISRRQPSPGDE